LTVCALLGGGACAEDHAPLAPDAWHHGSTRTDIPNAGVISASRGAEPIHGESKANTPSPDLLVYGPSNFQWGATELLVIRKLSGSTGDAAAGPRPAAGRTAFLLRKEHDVAIRRISTSLALKLKLSADGVHLNLAF
jgi:hypothetical protein